MSHTFWVTRRVDHSFPPSRPDLGRIHATLGSIQEDMKTLHRMLCSPSILFYQKRASHIGSKSFPWSTHILEWCAITAIPTKDFPRAFMTSSKLFTRWLTRLRMR